MQETNRIMLKRTAILFSITFFSYLGKAQKQIEANGLLSHATVYYGYGAELQHSAKVALPAGSQEIVINNISHEIDDKTIQIACPENVVLLSYRFNLKTETPKAVIDPLSEKMKDSLKILGKQLIIVQNDESVQNDLLARTTKLIEANLTNNPEKTIKSEELIKLIDYYTAKVQTMKTSIFALSQKREVLQDSINAIVYRKRTQENLVKPKVITDGQLILQVMSTTAITANFDITYFTRRAGWLPTYDLRVKTVDNSLKLVYKASVTQTTGIDWKQTKLTLSTGNPNQSSTAPILQALFVDAQLPIVFQQYMNSNRNMLSNSIQSFKKASGIANNGGDYMMEKEEKADEGNLVQAYTTLSESQLNTSFDIDLAYDIPSDGKAYSVGIKDEQVKASYKHYAVPKLDADAFLLAEISDWESLNLMPGEANIIMDNVYLGKTFIDPNTIADTINISLGRDKRVSVKRTLVKEYSKTKTKGDFKTDDYTYEIIVKNNKKTSIDMLLKDQFPISKTKEVEVTLTDDAGAELNADLNVLNWKIKLAPGESKKFRFSFTIKYPKEKKIVGL